nr:hypothetical protein [Candidatus Krumholzibacteria bacterium]
MRSMLMTVLFSLLLAGPALAVEEPADYPLSGLEFGLPSNLGLDDFGLRVVDGYDFSWTRRTSPSRGWRVGTSVYFDHDGDVDNNGDEGPGYWYFSSQESDRDLVRVSLRVQKLFVSEPRHGVSFVLGVGPVVGFERSSSENRLTREYVPEDPEDDDFPDPIFSENIQDRSWIWAGAAWDAGVEWRVSRQFTVGARYQWTLTYGWWDSNADYFSDGEIVRQSDSQDTDYGLSNGGVDLIATFWY